MVWSHSECLYQLFHSLNKYYLCYRVLIGPFVLFRELAELHKANASRASEAEEAALSRDVQAKEQLTFALEKVQEEARIQQEALVDQVMPSSLLQSIKLECLN